MESIRPPRDGTPVKEWRYANRPCCIYHAAEFDTPRQLPDGVEADRFYDLFHNAMCGYTVTELTGTASDLTVDVYGGLTYGVRDGWVGFDTVHAADDAPETLAEMTSEVESLVDQLHRLEAELLLEA